MMFNPSLSAAEFQIHSGRRGDAPRLSVGDVPAGSEGAWAVRINTAAAPPEDIQDAEAAPVVERPKGIILERKSMVVLTTRASSRPL